MSSAKNALYLAILPLLLGCDQGEDHANGSRVLLVPQDYRTIQEAIDASAQGDEIKIASGTYSDSIVINNKADLSIIGESSESVVISTGEDYGFSIYDSENISISHLSVTNADDGITSNSELFISDVIIHHTVDGIDMEGGSLTLSNSNFYDNFDDAIDLDQSTNALINNNFISRSKDDGIEIRLHPTDNDEEIIIDIRNNIISANGSDGIQLIDYELKTNRSILVRRNLFLSNGYNGISTKDSENTIPDLNTGSISEYLNISNNTFALNQIGNNASGESLASFNNVYYKNSTLDFQSLNSESFMNSISYSAEVLTYETGVEQTRFTLNSCFEGTSETKALLDTGITKATVGNVEFIALTDEKSTPDLGHIEIKSGSTCDLRIIR
ncbi:Parallel beta-helix repeat protein [Ferrimonas balearica DSM 9799]|uniref:Parallel beta-helix repeat protein n=1 Tax=Ferrimonas balearica (strain DSM 9799 / CCM 4581 / KCTC 23876 / PAT) TaxID=550540 RepID=E1SUV1_FERBD|nr:right-handed parallel beta-helix repeat-containing protein [Ferrimonas balearica]ADN75292.1 Parallel beta-helix repeat protein [Ferrimonas balearica DSM 9799]